MNSNYAFHPTCHCLKNSSSKLNRNCTYEH